MRSSRLALCRCGRRAIRLLPSGAPLSGGLAIVALPATVGAGSKSRVVAHIADGYVTEAQSDVDVVVTEYGVPDIRATTLAERRRLITALAEPGFHAALSEG